MTIKTLTVALALILAPMLSMAEGCSRDKQAMTCATGSSYDHETSNCIVNTS